jgi:hypothetical protein
VFSYLAARILLMGGSLFESLLMSQPEKKQKFIRKEWARFRAYIDSLPQNWFLVAGYILVAIGFCAAVYEFIWLGMLGGA